MIYNFFLSNMWYFTITFYLSIPNFCVTLYEAKSNPCSFSAKSPGVARLLARAHLNFPRKRAKKISALVSAAAQWITDRPVRSNSWNFFWPENWLM